MSNDVACVASKHGVLGLTRAAAVEAALHNVRINCLVPGLIETPMLMQLDPHAPAEAIRAMLGKDVPMGRIGTADEAAELACFLLSDRASHITAHAIAADGGILGTHSPSWATTSIKYYHAEPAANSRKSITPLIAKGIEIQSGYVDLHKFEQHSECFVAVNPEWQELVLVHDGHMITHITVINEYLEEVFPSPYRCARAIRRARRACATGANSWTSR